MTFEILEELIKKKKVKEIVKWLFDIDLTEKQQEIVRVIAFQEYKRVVISAYTRYGKSLSVSLGILLYILFNKDKKVRLIAPKYEQATIIRNYIAENIMKSKIMSNLIDLDVYGVERLKKEVSKSRITFKNNCELKILSAEGTAERLMGWGGDLIVVDEISLIDPETYRTKITRMLGDNPDSILVSIGNPWSKDNQMWEQWINPNFHKIHIPYQVGLKEGRIRKDFVEEQRMILTPIEFKILYDAEFPDESEDALLKYEWIENAVNRDLKIAGKIKHGVDVAELGNDLTVWIRGITDGAKYKVLEVNHWGKLDTMQTVGRLISKLEKNELINVDATGVGSGVASRLEEMGYNVVGVKVGKAPDIKNEGRDRFVNLKAEYYWHMREIFENGLIDIPKDRNLISQLAKMRYELTSGGKIKIIKPEDKSPDFADALMLFCAPTEKKKSGFEIISW